MHGAHVCHREPGFDACIERRRHGPRGFPPPPAPCGQSLGRRGALRHTPATAGCRSRYVFELAPCEPPALVRTSTRDIRAPPLRRALSLRPIAVAVHEARIALNRAVGLRQRLPRALPPSRAIDGEARAKPRYSPVRIGCVSPPRASAAALSNHTHPLTAHPPFAHRERGESARTMS